MASLRRISLPLTTRAVPEIHLVVGTLDGRLQQDGQAAEEVLYHLTVHVAYVQAVKIFSKVVDPNMIDKTRE